MNHSKCFEKVKRHYNNESWSIFRVREAVVRGWITPSEFKEITGKDYK